MTPIATPDEPDYEALIFDELGKMNEVLDEIVQTLREIK